MSNITDFEKQINEQQQLLAVSVLVTRDEYTQSASYKRRSKYSGISPAIILGFLFVILGLAGAFFGKHINLYKPASLSLILLGLFFSLYDSFFAPLFSSAAAAKKFDEAHDLQYSSTYIFTKKSVYVSNSRIQGILPLEYITKSGETSLLFAFEFGNEFRFVIPKRLLSDEQSELLRKLILTVKA